MSSEAHAFAVRHSPYRGATFSCHCMVGDTVNDAYGNEFWMSVGALAVKARVSRGIAGTAISTLCRDGFLTLLEERPGGTNRYRFEFPDVMVVFDSRAKARFGGDGRKVRGDRAPSESEVRGDRAGRCAVTAQGVRGHRALTQVKVLTTTTETATRVAPQILGFPRHGSRTTSPTPSGSSEADPEIPNNRRRTMNEKWCDWHVVVVEVVEDDTPIVSTMHPGCPFTVTVDHQTGARFEWACAIHYEIDNAGFDSILGAHLDDHHQPIPGWYRTRMRHVSVPYGGGFNEIDVEIETIPLDVVAVEPF